MDIKKYEHNIRENHTLENAAVCRFQRQIRPSEQVNAL
jgi:hypothetical protein